MDPLERQQQMLRNLSEPGRFPHAAPSVESIETHISTVLLAGDHVYKVKKPLNLGFLDFSSLDARRRFCAAELEINRKLAPGIYLGVSTIRGTPDDPRIDGEGPILEYAVHMRRFDRDLQLDRLLEQGELPLTAMDELALTVARFHESAERVATGTALGDPKQVLAPMLANFQALSPAAGRLTDGASRLNALETWTREAGERLAPLLQERRKLGFVRACHGDMHLGNMVYIDEGAAGRRLVIFDGIEFSPTLRCIDVISEVAFLTMDLHARGAPAHAHRLLNLYLEQRGDFEGLALLPFYQIYRALVRAKVHAIHAAEPGLTESQRAPCDVEVERYLTLAERLRNPGHARLVLMHGVSGSGKTHVSTEILQRLGGIRLRTDVERKRRIGLPPEAHPSPEQESEMYAPQGVREIYALLLKRTEALLGLDLLVIVDGTFLTHDRRRPFHDLARTLGVPYVVVACTADPEILRDRLVARERADSDASDAGVTVMERQLPDVESPGADEPAVGSSPAHPLNWEALDALLRDGPPKSRRPG